MGEENEGRDEDRRAGNDEIWIAGLAEKRQVRSTRGREEGQKERCSERKDERWQRRRRRKWGLGVDERRQDMNGEREW